MGKVSLQLLAQPHIGVLQHAACECGYGVDLTAGPLRRWRHLVCRRAPRRRRRGGLLVGLRGPLLRPLDDIGDRLLHRGDLQA